MYLGTEERAAMIKALANLDKAERAYDAARVVSHNANDAVTELLAPHIDRAAVAVVAMMATVTKNGTDEEHGAPIDRYGDSYKMYLDKMAKAKRKPLGALEAIALHVARKNDATYWNWYDVAATSLKSAQCKPLDDNE